MVSTKEFEATVKGLLTTKEGLSSDDKKNVRQFVKTFKESLQE